MQSEPQPQLDRGLTLLPATSLNVANMLGAGPFITIPVLMTTLKGPQSMLGWPVAMLLVMCDGLVWAELGAALPGSGGTYHFFKEIFRGSVWGRLLPFLFIWQFLISGTLEVASGYIGASTFALSLVPSLKTAIQTWNLPETVVVAIPACFMVGLIGIACCQRIFFLGRLMVFLTAGVLLAVGTVIVLGLSHFDSRLLTFPANAFHFNLAFLIGLGGATNVAVYDYLGYYNICHMGEEVRSPATTIPRSVLLSIVIVATIYVLMNVAFVGVVPWREMIKNGSLANQNVSAAFMTRLCGERVAALFTCLIIWTCLAGLFAMTLGYSRILYAAAKNGDFFSFFSQLHATRHYPWAALALLSVLTAIFCFFQLEIVITGAVTIRILVQFIGQIVALHILRRRRSHPLPFRMWLYPVPSLFALVGWLALLLTAKTDLLLLLAVVYCSGLIAFWLRAKWVKAGPSLG